MRFKALEFTGYRISLLIGVKYTGAMNMRLSRALNGNWYVIK
jgi:hypothetical protein